MCLTRACVMQKRLLKHAGVTQRRVVLSVLSDNDTIFLIINIYTPLSFRGIVCTQGIKREMAVSHGGFS